jgi:hypothetical protein
MSGSQGGVSAAELRSIPTPDQVESRLGTLEFNDGSPSAATGCKRSGKGFFVILRLYSPLQPFFDKAWRPGEIEPVDDDPEPGGTP